MSIRIRVRAKRRRDMRSVVTPALERFRAARADEAELRVDQLKANMMPLKDTVTMVVRRYGVVRRVLRAIPEPFVGTWDDDQVGALRAEIERALMPLNQDPLHVIQEAIL